MEDKAVYNSPLWSGPSSDPAYSGSFSASGFPFELEQSFLSLSITAAVSERIKIWKISRRCLFLCTCSIAVFVLPLQSEILSGFDGGISQSCFFAIFVLALQSEYYQAWKQPMGEMEGEAAYNKSLMVGPFLGPCV